MVKDKGERVREMHTMFDAYILMLKNTDKKINT